MIDVRISFPENKLMEFDQILHIPLYWEDLEVYFHEFVTELWPLIDVRICLRWMSWGLLCNDIDNI